MTNKSKEQDCHARALEGEPTFTLLARDPSAPKLVEKWANRREAAILRGDRPQEDKEKIVSAREKAKEMRAWRAANDGKWKK